MQYYDPRYFGVQGSVLGGNMTVVGYDGYGRPITTTGAPMLPAHHAPPGMIPHPHLHGVTHVPVHRPQWRDGQLAPGVNAQDEGLVPLDLIGEGGDTFTSAITQITFNARIQKPFRGERLLVTTVRTGTTAVGRLRGQLFVGTDLQQGSIRGFELETVGAPTAFGVRLTMHQAQPGVDHSIVTTLNTPVSGSDSIVVTMTILGRIIH